MINVLHVGTRCFAATVTIVLHCAAAFVYDL